MSGEYTQNCDVCGGDLAADSESLNQRRSCPACGSSVWFDRDSNQQIVVINATNSLDVNLLQRLSDSGHVLVLDFTQMGQISSDIPARLLAFDRKQKKQGKHMRMCGFRPEILNLLKLAKMDQEFDIYQTADEAVSNL